MQLPSLIKALLLVAASAISAAFLTNAASLPRSESHLQRRAVGLEQTLVRRRPIPSDPTPPPSTSPGPAPNPLPTPPQVKTKPANSNGPK
ncbi:hypothetical protein H4R33_004500, partial [Dimargaris cristalligena]